MLDESIQNRVIERFNREIGKDFSKLYRAAALADEYKQQLREVQEKLNYEDTKVISQIQSAFQNEDITIKRIEFEMQKLEIFSMKLKAKIKEAYKMLKGSENDLCQVRKLQNLVQYLKIVQDIHDLNNLLTAAMNGKDEGKLVNLYFTLYEENDLQHSVIGRLKLIETPFIKEFARNTAVYWHKLLKQRFSKEFEAILKSMRWGKQEHDSLTYVTSTEYITKAQLLVEYLFSIKSPAGEADQLDVISPTIICQPISTVTKFLLAPYRQRFTFHFKGTRQTNRLDKPEWFLTQIINWSKKASPFIKEIFQPAVLKAGKFDFNLSLEFLRGLVQLAIEKLVVDIEEISRDDILFAHLLDEVLSFEVEFRESFGYPAAFQSTLCVITQPVYLLKWISLEKKLCADRMDYILQNEDAWVLIDKNVLENELKIPKCADQFVRLLDAIKDRYYLLVQPGHQLQFLILQLEVIDNFRRRLVQLHSNNLVDTITILNAVNYMVMVLKDWGENVHYLHLHAAIYGTNINKINSVFDNCIGELEHWMHSLMRNFATKAINDIKAKSMPYRHDHWCTMTEKSSKNSYTLSTSGAEMFQVLATILHNLELELTANLLHITIRLIARQMDDFLLDSMIMNTRFSSGGASQFHYDISHNLFALFGQYSRRPDLLFKKVHDASKLLNATQGTAFLLYETLNSKVPLENKANALQELGLLTLKINVAVEVLERRTDIQKSAKYI